MKTKIDIRELSDFFGLVRCGKKTIKVKSTSLEAKSRFTISKEGEAFTVQFGSFEYPDPEHLPRTYDPQKDGN